MTRTSQEDSVSTRSGGCRTTILANCRLSSPGIRLPFRCSTHHKGQYTRQWTSLRGNHLLLYHLPLTNINVSLRKRTCTRPIVIVIDRNLTSTTQLHSGTNSGKKICCHARRKILTFLKKINFRYAVVDS